MPSLYSVIKNNNIEAQGKKVINTDYDVKLQEIQEETSVTLAESYENIGQSILDNAKRQKEVILQKALEEAQKIEKEAYERGYQLGKEQGYKDAYEANIEKARIEAQEILERAEKDSAELLFNAKTAYEQYAMEKKQEILNMAFSIAENILKRNIEKPEGIDGIITQMLDEYRECKTFIIKCHETHSSHIKESIDMWKETMALKSDVFVIVDNSINAGNAVIEKDNGKVIVGIDIGLDSIKQEIL